MTHIRWTANDHRRGLLYADQATITGIDKESVTVKTSAGVEHRLDKSDPMLNRLNLAYALNAHMAQGQTSALEVTQRLGKAAATGLAKENEAKQPEQKEKQPELAKEYAMNYDMSL